jgi:hypothetical protein
MAERRTGQDTPRQFWLSWTNLGEDWEGEKEGKKQKRLNRLGLFKDGEGGWTKKMMVSQQIVCLIAMWAIRKLEMEGEGWSTGKEG